MEMFSLKGKVAVITGAAGLLGSEFSQALCQAGASVVMTDMKIEELKKKSNFANFETFAVECDITSESQVESLKQKIINKYGRIDILVNNAAINDMVENPFDLTEQSKFENYPVELFRKVLDVNITGMFLCSKIIGVEMAKRGYGSIINIASTYGIVAPDQSLYINENNEQVFFKSPVYPASKGAVISFTKFLAAYWGNSGVRVNALSPGGTENGQNQYFIKKYSEKTPLKRMAQPVDYRGAVVFLAGDSSSYMTGANLVVDGGWTVW